MAAEFCKDDGIPFDERVFISLCWSFSKHKAKSFWKQYVQQYLETGETRYCDNVYEFIENHPELSECSDEIEEIIIHFYGEDYDIPFYKIEEWYGGFFGAFYVQEYEE